MRKKDKKPEKDIFKVKGEELIKSVKELIKEGNVREISILDKKGKTIVVIPLTVGVVGVALAPYLAMIGALAALLSECTIKVKRK